MLRFWVGTCEGREDRGPYDGMVGRRGSCWVGCWALLALACGRTAATDDDASQGAAPNAVGGSAGSSATTGGAGPTSHAGTTGKAGELGEAGAPADCPATPAAGDWFALGPDPYGLQLRSDGSHLSGEGCLGGLPNPEEPGVVECSPLALRADTGRRVEMVWTMKGITLGYGAQLALTLSPERTAMAGKVWTTFSGFDGEGEDIVFVRTGDEPLPAATVCSDGEPSGECFLGPLRSDRIDQLRVVELGGGDVLLLWQNRRGLERRVVSARFDATSGAWQAAEFLDDGSAPVDSTLASASPGGWAMVVYRQSNALWSRAYDPQTKVWSKQLVVAAPKPSDLQQAKGLFVYDGGNATLVASNQPINAIGSLAAYDYQASSKAWVSTHVFDGSPENATYQFSAAADSQGHELAVWVRGGDIGKPYGLWFSARSRSAASDWTSPALFFTSDKQVLKPAVAIGQDGAAIVTWQEWITRIGSSSYSFDTNTWSAPLTVTKETQIDNDQLRFNDAGEAVAYLYNTGSFAPYGELKSVLTEAGWSTPEASSEQEASGATYDIMGGNPLQLTRLTPRAGDKPLPGLERPRCEGY